MIGSLSAIQLGASGRLAKLQSEHIRLCLNSLALKPGLTDTMSMTSYIQKATEAAINTVQAHADSVKDDMYLSYSVDVRAPSLLERGSANNASTSR